MNTENAHLDYVFYSYPHPDYTLIIALPLRSESSTMNIVFYVIAAALLWVPVVWLFPRKHRLVRLSHVLDNGVSWRRWFRRYLVINLARAWLGAAVCFSTPTMEAPHFAWMAVIPAIGVCLQLWRGWHPANSIRPAPMAYLIGVTLALMPVICSLIVVVLAITLALCFRSIRLFFLVGAIAAPIVGYLLGAHELKVWLTSSLYLLPWLFTASRSSPLGLCLPIRNLPKGHVSSPMRKVPLLDSRSPFHVEMLREAPGEASMAAEAMSTK